MDVSSDASLAFLSFPDFFVCHFFFVMGGLPLSVERSAPLIEGSTPVLDLLSMGALSSSCKRMSVVSPSAMRWSS